MKRTFFYLAILLPFPMCTQEVSPTDDDDLEHGNTITEIRISPENAAIQIDQSLQFTATGYYESGSSTNLTSLCEWNSSNPDVAEIDENGVSTGKGYGTTNITAHYQGVTSNTATISVGSVNAPRVEIHGFNPEEFIVYSGEIEIPYTIYDEQAEAVSIKVEYSKDAGSTFRSATMGDGGDGIEDLASGTTAGGGVRHTFVWASGSDFPGEFHIDVAIRITPTDSSSNEGEPAETEIWDYMGDGSILIGIMISNIPDDLPDIYIEDLDISDAIFDIYNSPPDRFYYSYFEFTYETVDYLGWILFEECEVGLYSAKTEDLPSFELYEEPVVSGGYITGARRIFKNYEGVIEISGCGSNPSLTLGPSGHELHLAEILFDLDASVYITAPQEMMDMFYIYDGTITD